MAEAALPFHVHLSSEHFASLENLYRKKIFTDASDSQKTQTVKSELINKLTAGALNVQQNKEN